jgi:hypothetical protein
LSFLEKLAEFLDPLSGIAKICGLGGAAVAFALFIFKIILGKIVIPQPSRIHSYKIIRLIILCSFGIAVIGILTYGLIESYKHKPVDQQFKKNDSLRYEPLKLESKGTVITDSIKKK